MDKTRKKNIRRIISMVCVVAIVILLAVLPLAVQQNAESDGPQASILSGTVSTGSISNELLGGGTLTEEEAVTISVPAQVKLTKFLVSNGDVVKEGTPIAAVDRVTVMKALEQVQETLEYLSGEIKDAADTATTETVTALAGGTVKIIYAEVGESVQSVMLDHGALAVLSLDGLMAVDMETDSALRTGTVVTVTLSDGTVTSGKIVKNLAGEMTVTVEDDGYTVGDSVVVSDESGNTIGTAEMYIYSPWNATAYAGTVKSIHASEGSKLSAGKKLMVLENVGYSAEYRQLVAQRQEYEELMQELFEMYQTEVITAPCDGVVSGVDEESAYLLAAAAEESESVKLLSLIEETGADSDKTAQLSNARGGAYVVLLSDVQTVTEPSADNDNDADSDNGNQETTTEPTVTEPTATEPAETEPIETTPTDIYYGYVAKVVEIKDGIMKVKQTAYAYTVTDLSNLPTVSVDETALTLEVSYDVSQLGESVPEANDYALLVVSADGTLKTFAKQEAPATSEQTGKPSTGTQGASRPSGGSMHSGGIGGSVQQETVFELYGLDMADIAAVTPQTTVTLNITVDELEANALRLGMAAQIKIDALGGEKYTATVTEIGNSGENNGGNSKYTVELTMDRAENMLAGMNATAVIVLSETKNVLTIPAAALVEQGNETFVYTGYDEESGSLLNPTAVEIGCSDGQTVEVLAGLEIGQTYYYAYYDTLEVSFEPDFGRSGLFG